MAGQVFLKPFFTLGPSATDFTPVLASVGINIERTEVDDSRVSDAADQYLPGTFKGTLTLNFKAASGLVLLRQWATWFAADAAIAFALRPTTAVQSDANPTYSGSVVISKMAPIGGDRGTLFGAGSITLSCTGAVTQTDTTGTITFG